MQRQAQSELLDEDLGTPAEIRQSLRDLARINNWFGGTRATTELFRRVAWDQGCRTMSVLEVGAGDGNVPLRAKKRLAGDGIDVRITLLDRASSHLPHNGTAAIAAEALRLPFRADAFDVVSCNLLAHHFKPEELASVCTEFLRVARAAVLINDLIRSRLHLILTYAGLPLFGSRLTWHDAPASVRQAYSVGEMRDILSRTAARRIEISTHYLYRIGILLWK